MCNKSFVGCGFAPDPNGELTALPMPPSWFRGGPGEREGGRRGERRESRNMPKSRVGKPNYTSEKSCKM